MTLASATAEREAPTGLFSWRPIRRAEIVTASVGMGLTVLLLAVLFGVAASKAISFTSPLLVVGVAGSLFLVIVAAFLLVNEKTKRRHLEASTVARTRSVVYRYERLLIAEAELAMTRRLRPLEPVDKGDIAQSHSFAVRVLDELANELDSRWDPEHYFNRLSSTAPEVMLKSLENGQRTAQEDYLDAAASLRRSRNALLAAERSPLIDEIDAHLRSARDRFAKIRELLSE